MAVADRCPARPAVFALLPALLILPLAAASSGQPADEAAVVAVVQDLFDAMAAGDGAAIETLLLEEARLASVRTGPGGDRVVRSQDRAGFVAAIVGADGTFLERMWDPMVRIDGDLATLSAPYDFWIDGERSHCGTDAFQLLRTDAGWRIVHVAYTVQAEGCEPSPLGPPE